MFRSKEYNLIIIVHINNFVVINSELIVYYTFCIHINETIVLLHLHKSIRILFY